jgi:hypothetical protein
MLMNFAGHAITAQHLADEVVAAAQFEFFGHHAQRAVRRDEVDGLNPRIAFDGEQQMAQENRSTGASGGDGQVLRQMSHKTPEFLSIGSQEIRVKLG